MALIPLATIDSGSAITWGDLLIILAVIALILLILGGLGRWRH